MNLRVGIRPLQAAVTLKLDRVQVEASFSLPDVSCEVPVAFPDDASMALSHGLPNYFHHGTFSAVAATSPFYLFLRRWSVSVTWLFT